MILSSKIRKPAERIRVIALRKEGKSVKEIASVVGVSSSTVSLWARHVTLSPEQKQRLVNKVFRTLQKGRIKAQKIQKKIRLENKRKIEREAIKQLGRFTRRDIFILGVGLYWGEGFKKDNRLGFANLDPTMIKFFLEWLRINGVPKEDIRVRVGLNISHKKRIKLIEQYWSREVNIPLSQFQTPFFQKFKWKKEFVDHEAYFGVLRVRAINQGPFFIKIKKWVEKLREYGYTLISLPG